MKAIIPRIILIVLFLSTALFTYFEAVYLGDQARQLGRSSTNVILWAWVFRLVTAGLILAAVYLLYALTRPQSP